MKKFLTVFFTFTLYFNLVTQAHAAVGGWTMSNPVAKGASTVYTGIKNITLNGADYVKKGTAIVTPTASSVSKVLARGVAGYALSVAVEQLIGAVDWVLDPSNNRITWLENPELDPCTSQCDAYPMLWYGNSMGRAALYATAAAAAAAECPFINRGDFTGNIQLYSTYAYAQCRKSDGSTFNASINAIVNPSYDPNAEKEGERQKSISLDTVAAQVISNAESGNASAQVATTAAAADMVAEAEKDEVKARPISQQLEANATTKPADEAAAEKSNEATGEQTKNPDKADTTDIKLTFPIFCNWAPTVCQAAQTVITFPTTLTEWWTTGKEKSEGWAASISESWSEAKDWFTAPPEEPQKIDIPTKDLTEKSFLLNVITVNGAYCPADKSIEWDTPVGHFSKTVSYQNFCDASEWFGYLVLAAAYYMGALIVVRDS